MEAPCLLIKVGKLCQTYYEEISSAEIHTVICYCSVNKDKRVINQHTKPLLTLECPKRDLLRMIKALGIDLKILAFTKLKNQIIDISSNNYSSYFLSKISKEITEVRNGHWGCIILGMGSVNLCFCKEPYLYSHGLLC
jgi:hypothetical protein